MRLYRLEDLPQRERAVALGYFDGGHTGHAALLAKTAHIAKYRGYESCVFSFPSLPTKKGAPLFTLSDRLAFFERMGIESVILVPFEEVKDLSADSFAEHVLRETVLARAVVCGFNFRFGKGALGDGDCLARHFADCCVMPPLLYEGIPVSASRIREALLRGDIPAATAMLGRPYTVSGTVAHGKSLGRVLGFPTANITPATALPRFGVYKTEVRVEGRVYAGISDVGIRPTVENAGAPRVETFLADFSGDLYEKELSVSFLSFLREEKKFDTPEALMAQIGRDLENI